MTPTITQMAMSAETSVGMSVVIGPSWKLSGTDLTGGDFVRGCKRLADVLQQIAVAGPYLGKRAETLAPIAKQAYENVNRGIVAYSGVD